MAGELILLTGATGHVGFRVLVFALQAGYQVRAAVRNLSKTKAILETPSIRTLNPGSRLTFVEVPDMSVEGAFDEVLKGVDLVVHLAAPIASGVPPNADLEVYFFNPIVQGVFNLLESATKHDTIRRVVITSSIAAILDAATHKKTPDMIYTEDTRVVNVPPPPYQFPFQAYSAAKATAQNKMDQWVKEKKASFELINILPGYVLGPNELVTDPAEMLSVGTNRCVLAPVAGETIGMTPGTSAHLDDAANVHIKALDPKIPGNQVYLIHSGGLEGTTFQDSLEIVARNFPDEVGKTLPNNGTVPTMKIKVDTSKTEELLGIKWISFEQQVKDLVTFYLECLENSQKASKSSSA